MAQTSTPKFRRRMMPFVALALSVTLALLLGEALLRVFGFAYPVLTQADEHAGYAYVPNQKWVHSTEGSSVVQTNRFGFRDPEWSLSKPAGTFRIAVLGDSFVAALEVAQEDRFTDRLGQLLAQSDAFSGSSVEVMNFGQAGFGTAQELQVLRHKVLRFQPDLVLLAVFTGNDIRNNSPQLEGEPIMPYFDLVDGELRLDMSFRKYRRGTAVTTLKALAPYSRMVQLAYRMVHRIRERKSQPDTSDERIANLCAEFGFLDPDKDLAVYAPPPTEVWERAWQLTEALIARMQREAAEANAAFVVVTLSNDVQVLPSAESRERLEQIVGVEDLFYPDRRIEQICRRHQIPSLHLAESLQAYTAQTGENLHGFSNTRMGFGHWNETGHREAARRIATWLVQLHDLQPLSATRP